MPQRLLLRELSGGIGLLAIGLPGAVNIPYYGQPARSIHWWTDHGAHMIAATPYHIIFGEFGIVISLA